jgi:hypothetical protein
VALAGLEDDLGVRAGASDGVLGGAVKQDVVSGWRAPNTSVFDNLVGRLIVVVADGEDAEVDFVGERGRAVNQDGADNAVTVLRREVRVVPGAAVLLGAEAVLEGTSGGDGALGDAVGTIVYDDLALLSVKSSRNVDVRSWVPFWWRPCQWIEVL